MFLTYISRCFLLGTLAFGFYARSATCELETTYKRPTELSQKIEDLIELAKTTFKDSIQVSKRVFDHTQLQPNSSAPAETPAEQLIKLKTELKDIKTGLIEVLAPRNESFISSIYDDEGYSIVSNYFAALQYLAAAEMVLNKKTDLFDPQYSLDLVVIDYLRFFKKAHEIPNGVISTIFEGQVVLRLGNVAQFRTHVLATRISNNPNQETYFRTAQCYLSQLLVQKTQFQAGVLKQALSLEEFSDRKVCSGLLVSNLKEEVNVDELVQRQDAVQKLIGTAISHFSEEQKKRFQELKEQIGGQEEDLIYASGLAYSREELEKVETDPELEKLFTDFDELLQPIESQFLEKSPYMKKINALIPDLVKMIREGSADCKINIAQSDEKLHKLIRRMVNFYLLADVVKSPLMSDEFNPDELTNAARILIAMGISKQVEHVVISQLVADEMIEWGPATEDLRNAIRPHLIDYLIGKLNETANSPTMVLAESRPDFFKHYDKATAEQMHKVMSPETPLTELEFRHDILRDNLAPSIQTLPGSYPELFTLAVKKDDYEQAKSFWLVTEQQFMTEFNVDESTCILPSTMTNITNYAKGLLSKIPGVEIDSQLKPQHHCETIRQVRNALGFDRETPPENLGDVWPRFEEYFSQSQPGKWVWGNTLAEIETEYRRRLKDGIAAQAPYLDFTLRDLGKDSDQPLYEKLIASQDNSEIESLLQQAFQLAAQRQKQHLDIIVKAQKLADLDPYLAYSNAMNYFLGEEELKEYKKEYGTVNRLTGTEQEINDASKIVPLYSPALLTMHQEHQKSLSRKFKIDRAKNASLYQAVQMPFWGIAGGAIARWSFLRAPWWMGGAALNRAGSLIDVAGKSTSLLISGYFSIFSISIAHEGYSSWKDMNRFAADLQALNELKQTDALMTNVTRPLLDYDNYILNRDFFESQYESAKTNFRWNVFFGAVIGGTSAYEVYSAIKYARHLNRMDDAAYAAKVNAAPVKNPKKLAASIRKLEARIQADLTVDLRRLASSFNKLGRPASWNLVDLKNAVKTASDQRAYENIVFTLGQRLRSIRGYPEAEKKAAEALFGHGSQVAGVHAYVDEFLRLFPVYRGAL